VTISVQDLAEDPSLFLLALEPRAAHFQRMSRDEFHRSIFLDKRIAGAAESRFQVPIDIIRHQQWPEPSSRPVGLIFHVAHCGSTLLARALDLPGRSLVLREPTAIRRLGVEARATGTVDRDILRFALSLLGKRWDGDAPVVVKANVPANFIADEILAIEGDVPAILLYLPLNNYVAAVMRTEAHAKWVDTVFEELRLADSGWIASGNPASTPERAGCLWYAQMQIFAEVIATNPRARSLDAHMLFERPAETVHQAAELFGIAISTEEAEEIAAGDIFATYSKNPTLDYDLEVRAAREEDAMRRLASPIAEAQSWVRRACTSKPIPDSFDRPLIGGPVALLN
jgi:hypothetical protein